MTLIKRPSEVVLFADAIPRKTPADPSFPMGWICWTPTLDGSGAATLGDAMARNGRVDSIENFDMFRHGKRINVMFADGHVETFPLTPQSLGRAYLLLP
jgi:prepilin-type processing-associated H-X9-DG protein